MSGKLEKPGEPMDLQHPLIRQVAEMIAQATGEQLLIVTPQFSGWEQAYVASPTPHISPFCKLIQGSAEGVKHCRMCHILMAVAACSGGAMEQRCHAGATVLACPIATTSGEAMAVLGACMFTSPTDWEDVRRTGESLGINLVPLRKAFRNLPQPDAKQRRLIQSALLTMSLALQVVRQNNELSTHVHKTHTEKSSPIDLERFLGETGWAKPPHHHGTGAAGEKPLLVHVVCELVRQRPDLPLSVKELAAAARLTPNHFTTLFRQHAGCPFTEFLTEQRISRAKKLLRNPTLSINEVSQLVGYEDPGYFTRRFREKTRLSPRQWRNRQTATDAPA